VRTLEAVASAISSGQISLAGRKLGDYGRRFPRGELSIEAAVLGIQIALARGERGAARAAAERLLARPEAGHYGARVRALLDRPTSAVINHDVEPIQARSKHPATHMKGRR
jgi:hypothetical protein